MDTTLLIEAHKRSRQFAIIKQRNKRYTGSRWLGDTNEGGPGKVKPVGVAPSPPRRQRRSDTSEEIFASLGKYVGG